MQSTKIRTAVVANLGVSAIPSTGATGVASAATNTGTTAQTTGHSATGATYATSGATHTGTRRQLTCKSLSGAGAGTLTDPLGCVDQPAPRRGENLGAARAGAPSEPQATRAGAAVTAR